MRSLLKIDDSKDLKVVRAIFYTGLSQPYQIFTVESPVGILGLKKMMQISWEIIFRQYTSLSDNFLKPSNARRKDRKHRKIQSHQSEAHIVVVRNKQNIANCHDGESQLN